MTAIQRFGGGLNLHVHFHTLALDGVYVRAGEGGVVFHALSPPADAEVRAVLATIATRITRLLVRRGLAVTDTEQGAVDAAADLSPSLALVTAGAVRGRQALGPAAGRPIAQLGRDPTRPWQPAGGPRQAHQDGFDLHANVCVGPLDRRGREHLVQYVLRPPLAQQRLHRRADGHVVLTLQRPWRDGTRALVFPPLAVLERLAALTPRPRINLLIYHGVLAPNAGWRAALVPAADGEDEGQAAPGPPIPRTPPAAGTSPGRPCCSVSSRSTCSRVPAAAAAYGCSRRSRSPPWCARSSPTSGSRPTPSRPARRRPRRDRSGTPPDRAPEGPAVPCARVPSRPADPCP